MLVELSNMHVQFEFTLDECVDAQKRFTFRFKVARSLQWKNLLSVAFFAWLFVIAFFYRSPVNAVIFGFVAAALSAFLSGLE